VTTLAADVQEFVATLPAPLDQDTYHLHRRGIHDDPEIAVYVNAAEDFAFLYPQPASDYVAYQPRFEQLGLAAYRKTAQVAERRFEKVGPYLKGAASMLEIGAADGAFLEVVRRANPELTLACLETDRRTKASRDRLTSVRQYASFDEVIADGRRFDVVGFFHVLEHIVNPAEFLARCRAVLAPGGLVIIEVPSLDEPLLRLYRVPEYAAFFFQAQHPYVYSARSLRRVLEAHGFTVQATVPHQRYGLENHLTWLAERRPGGDERLRTVFAPLDEGYRHRLESEGLADAVIVVAQAKAR